MSTQIQEQIQATTAVRRTVLVVDDDPDYLEGTSAQLVRAGYQVVRAASAAEARGVLARDAIDAAVVDLMLEEPDGGFALCHAIKKSHPQMPVVIVSTVTSETGLDFDIATESERRWIKADALLAKPIRFEQLQSVMRRLMKE